jgi:magnesium transporter
VIHAFAADQTGRLVPRDLPAAGLDGLIWIDMIDPSPEERARIEDALAIELPSREEMQEIELSARLYREGEATFMTASLTAKVSSAAPEMAPVTFALIGEKLITVRHHEPMSFQIFTQQAAKTALGCINGESVLVALLESIVARIADVLELCGRDVASVAQGIFGASSAKQKVRRDLERTIAEIGRVADVTTNVRDSLVTLERLVGFLGQALAERNARRDLRARIKSTARDVLSLGDHTSFLLERVNFLLDATLGLINIEQSEVMRIFSVVAVIFLPPTLIASMYGMNFPNMPELASPIGYPLAVGAMVATAVLPYLYFRWRGWL